MAELVPTRAWPGLPVPWPFTLQDLLLMSGLLAPWLSSSTLSSQDNYSASLFFEREHPPSNTGAEGAAPRPQVDQDQDQDPGLSIKLPALTHG